MSDDKNIYKSAICILFEILKKKCKILEILNLTLILPNQNFDNVGHDTRGGSRRQ